MGCLLVIVCVVLCLWCVVVSCFFFFSLPGFVVCGVRRRSLFVVGCLLFVVCCVLCVALCLFRVVGVCSLCVVGWLMSGLFSARCVMRVACRAVLCCCYVLFPVVVLCCCFVVLFVAVRCLVVFVVGVWFVGCRLFLCLLLVLLVAWWLACGGSYFCVWCVLLDVACLVFLGWRLLFAFCCLWRVG